MIASWYRLQQRIAITSNEATTLAVVAMLLAVGAGLRAWDGAPAQAYAPPSEAVSAYVTDALAGDLPAAEPAAASYAETGAIDAMPDSLPTAARTPGHSEAVLQIDPNTASAAELERLPRIGPAMAARIITRRERRPFTRADDLLAVRGIGPKTLDTLRPHLTFE